ncbi:MAG TPA: 50S ribosomal protein L9 [Candidatus Paceibacterota bacterium]|nr:50S ribosomal protein L9 [Candidatus Paceibacterota bacterium]
MKVILLKDVRGVGVHNEVKNVPDGYALNYLFPHKLAEPATEDKIKKLSDQKAAHDAEVQKAEDELAGKILSLREKKIVLSARATEKGGLFKAIDAKDIVRGIKAEHGVDIPESAVFIKEPIKTTGEHEVALHSKSQKANLTVTVIAAA